MGVTMQVTYEGQLRCRAAHGPSHETLWTDAPQDNQGEGKYFSPTDLLATALGTCMLTTMGIAAKVQQADMRGATARVEKHMGATPRRHVAQVTVHITLPQALTEHQRGALERAALGCPVHASLAPTTVVQLTFEYV